MHICEYLDEIFITTLTHSSLSLYFQTVTGPLCAVLTITNVAPDLIFDGGEFFYGVGMEEVLLIRIGHGVDELLPVNPFAERYPHQMHRLLSLPCLGHSGLLMNMTKLFS